MVPFISGVCILNLLLSTVAEIYKTDYLIKQRLRDKACGIFRKLLHWNIFLFPQINTAFVAIVPE